MSQVQIEQFYARVKAEPALMQELMANFTTPEDFTARVVAKGKELGYEFSYAEAETWIEQQRNVAESVELSDMQLEAVSGGKSSNSVMKDVKGEVKGVAHEMKGGISYASNKVSDFFSGW